MTYEQYITRASKSSVSQWRENRLIQVTETLSEEGTCFLNEDTSSENMINTIEKFASGVASSKDGYHLTNITVNAERSWFDYTAEYQKITYPNAGENIDISVDGITLSEARVNSTPPKPRTVKIYIPGLDGPIVQKFGMSDGILSVEGFASGNVSLNSSGLVTINAGTLQKKGVIESYSSSYDPKLNETNINVSISYQPE